MTKQGRNRNSNGLRLRLAVVTEEFPYDDDGFERWLPVGVVGVVVKEDRRRKVARVVFGDLGLDIDLRKGSVALTEWKRVK